MSDDLHLYDPRDALPPTMVMTVEREAALISAWEANGRLPLSADQVTAAVGVAPPPVTSLPPDPRYTYDLLQVTNAGLLYRDIPA